MTFYEISLTPNQFTLFIPLVVTVSYIRAVEEQLTVTLRRHKQSPFRFQIHPLFTLGLRVRHQSLHQLLPHVTGTLVVGGIHSQSLHIDFDIMLNGKQSRPLILASL